MKHIAVCQPSHAIFGISLIAAAVVGLSTIAGAPHFSPPQNIHIILKWAAYRFGNVHYRQHIPTEVHLAKQQG